MRPTILNRNGITCEIGLALAFLNNGKFVLLGRSNIDSIDTSENWPEYLKKMREKLPGKKPVDYKKMWEKNERAKKTKANIERYKLICSEVNYMAIDLTDENAVNNCIENIKNKFGGIDHLIHGAGIDYSKNFIEKNLEIFYSVFNSKVSGLQYLIKSLCKFELKSVYLFSSVAAIRGNIGQSDYASANNILMDITKSISHAFINSSPYVKTICWPAWGEVGMAMDPLVRLEMERKNIEFIGVSDGVDFFIKEFINRSISSVVFCTSSKNDSLIQALPFISKEQKHLIVKHFDKIKRFEYIDHVLNFDEGKIIFEKHFSGKEKYLAEHIIKGSPTIPAVVLTEMMLEIIDLMNDELKFSLQEIVFLNSCQIPSVLLDLNAGLTFSTELVKNSTGDYSFEIRAPKVRSDGAVLIYEYIYCKGIIGVDKKEKFIEDLKTKFSFNDANMALVINTKDQFYEKLKLKFPEFLGESFQNLLSINYKDENTIIGTGEFSQQHGFGNQEILYNGAVFDLMNQMMVEYDYLSDSEQTYIPYGYFNVQTIKSFKPNNKYWIEIKNIRSQKNELHFEVIFRSSSGEPVMIISKVIHKKYQR